MKMKRLLLFAWFLPLLMACALLGENLPFSPSASPSPAMEPTASAPSSVPTLVPTSTSAPAALQMVFSTTDGIFLWREGAGTRFLTAGDRDLPSRVRLSQDGQVIAFLRGGELFAINADGTGERMLVSRDYLEANRPAGEDIVAIGIDSFAFLPGTHDVLFSLSVETISFPLLLEDLHRVNADAPSPARLLAERQGSGRWFPAPDGQSLILVRANQIACFRLQHKNSVSCLNSRWSIPRASGFTIPSASRTTAGVTTCMIRSFWKFWFVSQTGSPHLNRHFHPKSHPARPQVPG